MDPIEKYCKKCDKNLPISEFFYYSGFFCKEHFKERQKEIRESKSPEELAEYQRSYKEKVKNNNPERHCKKCDTVKSIDNFYNPTLYTCKECEKKEKAIYRSENDEIIKVNKKIYYEENKEKIAIKDKEYRENNKEKIAKSAKENYEKEKLKFELASPEEKLIIQTKNREKSKKYGKKQASKRKSNPLTKLRDMMGRKVWQALHVWDGSKGGRSCMDFIPYEIQDLKIHLENQFEWWMNWENHGIYNKLNWDDNDPSTWKWQIDHIIPQADLSYDSMEHPNFLKSWALSNLRPYSAKQNMIDGVRRTRHKKE